MKKLSELNSWENFFSFANSLTEKQKGDVFESLTKLILTTRPEYCSILKNVWIQREGIPTDIREKLNLPTTDEGIDLIAETFRGEYWAIQCKFKGQNQPPNYKELSTFGNLANNYCKNISLTLLVHTGEKGVRKKKLLGENYTEIGLDFWLGLTAEDWVRIHKHLKGQLVRPKPKSPRPHQQKAIDSAIDHYLKNNAARGRLIMPCGTGKSLAAFWIASALEARSIIVAVPSLALIKQSLEDWTREFVAHREDPIPQWLVICSDESTSKLDKDEFVSDTYSMGIPTTTDVDVISSFLADPSDGRKIIFTTYQSSEKLAQAARACNFSFDLSILDEAHKTVGVKSKTFATLLQDKNILIARRMFMTATERVLRGSSDEVFSMDDPDTYGDLFYQLCFKEAINAIPPIISDYKILTMAVTNAEIEQLIKANRLVTDKGNKVEEQDAQVLAAAIALRKATQSYGIRHAISFHRSIQGASDFSDLHKNLNNGNLDNVFLSSSHISSKKSAGERARLLTDFAYEKQALMTNARCLTEGVDVPAIDCVLFADPKQSTIDIVQAAGRALRPYAGKEFGYIMLPLIVPDEMALQEFTNSTPFRQVARIITALSTQDEGIAEEFRITSAGKQSKGGKILFDGTIPVGLKLSLSDFADHIYAKIWDRVAKVNWRSFEEARGFVKEIKLNGQREWWRYGVSDEKPNDIPYKPHDVYKNKGWEGYSDWLGTNTIASQKKKFLPFLAAREYVHRLNLKTWEDWRDYAKSDKKPINIPTDPNLVYKTRGWNGMNDWVGNFENKYPKTKYLPFEEAKVYIHQCHFLDWDAWNTFRRSRNLPDNIPANPSRIYHDSGWRGKEDWLGLKSTFNQGQTYLTYDEARGFVHKLKLLNIYDWRKYCKSGKMPDFIPIKPERAYLGVGWKGFGDWFGTGRTANRRRNYLPYSQAREFVHGLGIKSRTDWRKYCQSKKKPSNIPLRPEQNYAGKGWIDYSDWLGKNK